MSNILEIYTSISDMTISSIEARNIDKINLTVTDGALPVRLLLPETSGELSFVGLGALSNMNWVIRDLCLYAPISAGSGIEQFAEGMVNYISLYIDEIKANRCVSGYGTILSMEAVMGPIEWATKNYWAIDITLVIKETV